MKIKLIVSSITIMLMTACSTQNTKPDYVSPVVYQDLNCNQLNIEYQRIEQYIKSGVQRSSSRVGTGIGVGLGGGWNRHGGWGLFPTVYVNMGQSTTTKRSELARLLGEKDAIAQASRFKNCPIYLPLNSETNTNKSK